MKNLQILLALFSCVLFFNCQSDSLDGINDIIEEQENTNEEETNGDVVSGTSTDELTEPSTTHLRTFIFGHSLLVHEPPAIPTPSDETAVPHWMASLAAHSNFDYEVSGQYGFLPQHAELPPFSQWGFDIAAPAWDSDIDTFASADFNSVLLTAGNFIQYQPASDNYYNSEISPVDATLDIFDWAASQETGITLYIYENWPDMAGFIEGESFPPSANEFANYNAYTTGDFHNWWIDYHDAIVAQRPDMEVKMIPVGPIVSGLLTETELSGIQITELYEDNAPHGRPTIYFLAGMVTYMAMYGTQVPTDYPIPSTVDPLVSENFEATINYIWEELEAFDFPNGNSRVF